MRQAYGVGSLDVESLAVCAAQLAVEPDPRIGASVLTAVSQYPLAGAPERAAGLIARLTERGELAVAAGIAAKLAFERGAFDEALARLRAAHAAGAPGCAVARIATWLAGALYEAGRIGGAQEAVALGLEALAPLGDDGADVRGTLRVVQCMLLAGIGNPGASLDQTDAMLAERPAPTPQQLAWIYRTRIWPLYTRFGPHQAEATAWEAMRQAWIGAFLEGATASANQVQSSALISLATMMREQRRFDEAERALDLAAYFTPDDPTAEKLFFRALIHRDRGDLGRAEAGLRAALVGGAGGGGDGKPPAGDLVAAIPIELARLRRAAGDRAGAEAALRDALGRIEQLRASIPASDGMLIAKHRQAYEELLGLLVEQARWADAFAVLGRLDAGRLVSDIGAPRERSPGRDAAAAGVGTAAWVPPTSTAPRAPAGAEELLAAWRGRHLVAVFRAGPSLCRLEAEGGALRGACMGESEPLERAAEALREEPSDERAANAVARAVLPDGDDRLDLLLVGPIGRAPIAALRDDDGLVVARRPLQRVLGLLDDASTRTDDGPPRVVGFAGASRQVAAAEREAREVAEQLGVPAAVGAEATRAAVIGGRAGLLHVAGHAHLVDGVPELELHDGSLSANEIAAQPHAPRLVVLASCESAAAGDEGGWGSLAAAFLHAGSERVIASDRAVDDEEAQALMRAFYAAGGLRDPARALGASQAARAAALPAGALPPEATTWAAFTVIAAPPRLPPTR
jgi:tetratricopeptide (TPR) repeat protein